MFPLVFLRLALIVLLTGLAFGASALSRHHCPNETTGPAASAALTRLTHQGPSTSNPTPEEVLQKGDEAWQKGDVKTAEKLYFDAVKKVEATYGSKDPRLAKGLIKLSTVYFPLELRAPMLLLDTILPFPPGYRVGHFNIGMNMGQRNQAHVAVDYFRRKYLPARPYLERAVHVLEQGRGPDHIEVANALEELAALHLAMGAYDQAEPLYERMFSIREKSLGPDNPELVRDLNMLSYIKRIRRKFPEAQAFAKRAVALPQPEDDASFLRTATLYSLATAQIELKEFALAEELIRTCIALHEKQDGRGHTAILWLLVREHAFILDKLKRKEEAKQQRARTQVLRKAMESRK